MLINTFLADDLRKYFCQKGIFKCLAGQMSKNLENQTKLLKK